jgi:hypothetical protein
MVLKVSSQPELNATTVREHDHLLHVRAALPPAAVASIPRPIALYEWRGRTVAVESHLDGRTVEGALRECPADGLGVAVLDEVTTWVIRLHRHTATWTVWDEGSEQRWFAPVLDTLHREVTLPASVDALLDRAAAVASSLRGSVLPLVHRHADLGPWNIMRSAAGLGVVDWESAPGRPLDGIGLPVCDLAYFQQYWMQLLSGNQAASDVGSCTVPVPGNPRATGQAIRCRASMRRYCREVGVDDRFVGPLTVYCWAEHACNAVRRSATLRGAGGGPAPFVAILEALSRTQATLFS